MKKPLALLLAVLLAAACRTTPEGADGGLTCGLVDELVEVHPDSRVANLAAAAYRLDTPRGVPAGVHVLLEDVDPRRPLSVRLLERGEPVAEAAWYELIPVPVEENTGVGSRTEQFEGRPNPWVIRRAPFEVFEALAPVSSPLVPRASTTLLRVELPVERDAPTGPRRFVVEVAQEDRAARLDWVLEVHAPAVAEPGAGTLPYTNWFSPQEVAARHGLELWSEPFWDMLALYADLMARGRQNTFWVRWEDHFEDADGDGLPELRRERFERYVRTFLGAGLYWIEGAPIARRPDGDWSKDWLELRVVAVPATQEQGRDALEAMSAQLLAVLDENGWRSAWLQHVADEPTDVNAADYARLAEGVRRGLPGVSIVEATMSRDVIGAVDIWCPQVHEYQAHRDFFERRQELGDSVWVYTCLVPGGPWLNRLLDQERLRQVYFGWAAARFDLQGYLHWGLNHYKADPFEQSVVDHPAQPNTTNKLPAGDTHVIYPGDGAPWSGQRFEAHRIGLEDHDLLTRLEAKSPERMREIVHEVFRAFDDYELNVAKYRAARRELLIALQSR